MKLAICHLYPDLMNTYGDRGNMIALCKRASWRGIELEIHHATIGDKIDFNAFDLVFFGGGQDKEQRLVCQDLIALKKDSLVEAIENGVVVLAICGGYQLLGEYYRTGTGEELFGVGALNIRTEAGKERFVGNVVIEMGPLIYDLPALHCAPAHKIAGPIPGDLDSFNGATVTWGSTSKNACHGFLRPDSPAMAGRALTLVGFENHSGRTYLGAGVTPLGKVLVGNGNNGEDGTEGCVYKNTFGTYLHGPLLPKNPHFADYIIWKALNRRYGEVELSRLDDRLELNAHHAALLRSRS